MNPDLGIILLALFVGMVFLGLWRRRQAIVHKVMGLAFILLFGTTIGVVAWLAGYDPQRTVVSAFVASILAALFLVPRRGRYIRKSERRRVIARFERTGQRYDSRQHEIDHIVPFSRGGSNTADNLRVVAKRRNRSKGDRSTWWDFRW